MKITLNYIITYYTSGKLDSYKYINLDFTKNKDMWRVIERNIFFVAGRLVFWETKQQETVVIFTVKVKYMAFTSDLASILAY